MLAFLSVAVAALLSLAALAYVVWPLVSSRSAPLVVEDDRLTALIGRKDAVMVAIKDLEFDYHTGKLGDEDYARLDERLRRQAIGLMQQVEKLAPESAVMDERLEAEIARLRKTRDGAGMAAPPAAASPAAAPTVAPVTAPFVAPAPPVAAESASVQDEGPRFCTTCGHPMQPAHKFCANCGTPVAAMAAAAAAAQAVSSPNS